MLSLGCAKAARGSTPRDRTASSALSGLSTSRTLGSFLISAATRFSSSSLSPRWRLTDAAFLLAITAPSWQRISVLLLTKTTGRPSEAISSSFLAAESSIISW